MKLRDLAKFSLLFIMASTALPALVAAQAKSSPPSGVFCMANSREARILAIQPDAKGALKFGASYWTLGNNFAVFGVAKPQAGGWIYQKDMKSSDPAERCSVNISLLKDNSYYLKVDPNASCLSLAGHDALVPQSLFPPYTKESVVTHELDNFETFMNAGNCAHIDKSLNP